MKNKKRVDGLKKMGKKCARKKHQPPDAYLAIKRPWIK